MQLGVRKYLPASSSAAKEMLRPSPQACLLIPESWFLQRSFRDHGQLAPLYHRTDKLGYFVLQSSRYSCLTWRPCIRSHGSVYFIRLGDVDDATAAEAPWRQVHLTALDEWRVMIPRPLTHAQAEARWGRRIGWHHDRVHAWRREQAAVAHGCTAAETAFKTLTRHVQGLLWDDVWDARKPTPEFDLCFQLVQKVLPHLSTFELVSTRALKKKTQNLTRSSPKRT